MSMIFKRYERLSATGSLPPNIEKNYNKKLLEVPQYELTPMINRSSIVGDIWKCSDGEYTWMEVGGKPRWVKNARPAGEMPSDDNRPYLWDKMKEYMKLQNISSPLPNYADALSLSEQPRPPGKILEYL